MPSSKLVSRVTARSATSPEFSPGALVTAIPLARHSSRSTLLNPAEMEAIILSFGNRESITLSSFSILAESKISTSPPRSLMVASMSFPGSIHRQRFGGVGNRVCISGCIARIVTASVMIRAFSYLPCRQSWRVGLRVNQSPSLGVICSDPGCCSHEAMLLRPRPIDTPSPLLRRADRCRAFHPESVAAERRCHNRSPRSVLR